MQRRNVGSIQPAKVGRGCRGAKARIERGRDGENKLGNAREIGAIWPRDGKDGEGILRFDHTPEEQGVYFVRALEAEREAPKDERTAPRKRDTGRER